MSDFDGLTLKNCAAKKISVDDISPFVEICFKNKAKRIVVRKSSMVWLLRKDWQRMSSDRLQRVRCPNEIGDVVKTYKTKRHKKGTCLMYPCKNSMRNNI